VCPFRFEQDHVLTKRQIEEERQQQKISRKRQQWFGFIRKPAGPCDGSILVEKLSLESEVESSSDDESDNSVHDSGGMVRETSSLP